MEVGEVGKAVADGPEWAGVPAWSDAIGDRLKFNFSGGLDSVAEAPGRLLLERMTVLDP